MRKQHHIIIILLATLEILTSCHRQPKKFDLVPSAETGIGFSNTVVEDSLHNVLEYMNIYTGGGVAAGDINNDGLPDLFFSGNETSSRLYLNRGGLRFEDISEKAGLVGNRWCTGVSMVDINGDGWLDIYVNVAGSAKFGDMHNLLYINDRNGHFTESAAAYGIAETRQTMNASFFDYDLDGDLDLFLITNPADEMMTGVNNIRDRSVRGESAGTDILYRNDGNRHFTDVSREAGILSEGYSLGAAISDVNGDGWPDIYVSNDFLTNDLLYMNNGNGTFTDRSAECLKHTSFASMGNDIADINNDGLPDIYTLDMLPQDNFRRKMIIPAAGFDRFQLSVERGYSPQYTRNALQLNNGNGTFSDIGFLSGISGTDWSWSALWADYDNDGDKDLMVTNGFYRDLGDLDYITYQSMLKNPMGRQDYKKAEQLKTIKKIANVPLQNYLFENNGDLTFSNRTDAWGFTEKGFSNGACYADLDNDGDLDLVINCFNGPARVYRNNGAGDAHFLDIVLKDSVANVDAIGAKIWLFSKAGMQFQENNPYRGYESSVPARLHFGLGKDSVADSLRIVWPDGSVQLERALKTNQTVTINRKVPLGAKQLTKDSLRINKTPALFADISSTRGLDYIHREPNFVDFKVQPLLPHMFSKNGPGIAVGDVNGDGIEDFFIGGTAAAAGRCYFQTREGNFIASPFVPANASDNMGVLLFDADNDNDLDLYVAGGGSENALGSPAYQDLYYENDGKGNFISRPAALPEMHESKSTVIAADFDHDGDLDLFVGGRVSPGAYPMPPRSYLLRNDGLRNGQPHFTDVTGSLCPGLARIGMVTAALWSDYDNDGWKDLVLVGEFMPLTIIRNRQGTSFARPVSVPHTEGWWNSLTAGDFDNDGDIDYAAGNLGLNSRHKATPSEPLCIYAKDFDKNGLIDPVMCYYVDGKNYIYPTRDDMIRQIASMRVRFPTYKSYAEAEFSQSFTKAELADAYVVKSECFESSFFRNEGNGQFRRTALPVESQFGPVFGMLTGDFDGDGETDLLLAGNDWSTEASTGRYDALTGLLLAGDGRGGFRSEKSGVTGFAADHDVKSLAAIPGAAGSQLILTGNNSGQMQAYQALVPAAMTIPVKKADAYVIVRRKDGRSYRQEFYFGSNYLSQSSRNLRLGKDVSSISIFEANGQRRDMKISP